MDGLPRSPRTAFVSRLAAITITSLLIAACGAAGAPTQEPVAALSPGVAATSAASATSPTIPPSRAPTHSVVTITPIPGAPDSGVVVELGTNGFGFSLTNIDAPANKVWHLHVVRTGGNYPPNNFTLATGPTSAEWIFHSRNLALGEYTFDIPALPAGNYLFYCTIDPTSMHGTVTIR